jgi:hypothetical protein
MNENDFDLAARAWLDDGPTRMSDRVLLSALGEIHTTRQRRGLWPARRATPVSIFARVAIAAVLLIAVGLMTVNVLQRQPDGPSVGGARTPTPVQVLDFPDLTTIFVSPRNGFSIKHPDGVALTPAKQLWGVGQINDGFDLVETGLAAVLRGASTEILDGASIDELVDDAVEDSPGGCGAPRSQPAEIIIDGQSGRIVECSNEIVATVIAGGRGYLFALSHDRSDARALFDAFAATIDLTPETAVDLPNLTTTFVSPTYGFSFKYPRGEPKPATELWDPVNHQRNEVFDRFDAVETGLAAYLEGASTQIPDGVSIDDWVDEYVTPLAASGCGVPRSQQAEITVDGQSGRFAECQHGIQATVVAGGRLYLFILLADRSDARAFFDTWIATIDLRPEDAAVPSSTPSS